MTTELSMRHCLQCLIVVLSFILLPLKVSAEVGLKDGDTLIFKVHRKNFSDATLNIKLTSWGQGDMTIESRCIGKDLKQLPFCYSGKRGGNATKLLTVDSDLSIKEMDIRINGRTVEKYEIGLTDDKKKTVITKFMYKKGKIIKRPIRTSRILDVFSIESLLLSGLVQGKTDDNLALWLEQKRKKRMLIRKSGAGKPSIKGYPAPKSRHLEVVNKHGTSGKENKMFSLYFSKEGLPLSLETNSRSWLITLESIGAIQSFDFDVKKEIHKNKQRVLDWAMKNSHRKNLSKLAKLDGYDLTVQEAGQYSRSIPIKVVATYNLKNTAKIDVKADLLAKKIANCGSSSKKLRSAVSGRTSSINISRKDVCESIREKSNTERKFTGMRSRLSFNKVTNLSADCKSKKVRICTKFDIEKKGSKDLPKIFKDGSKHKCNQINKFLVTDNGKQPCHLNIMTDMKLRNWSNTTGTYSGSLITDDQIELCSEETESENMGTQLYLAAPKLLAEKYDLKKCYFGSRNQIEENASQYSVEVNENEVTKAISRMVAPAKIDRGNVIKLSETISLTAKKLDSILKDIYPRRIGKCPLNTSNSLEVLSYECFSTRADKDNKALNRDRIWR
jgi:hypothetical protein